MLIIALSKLFSFFFSASFMQQHVSVTRKLSIKSLGKKCQALRDLENGLLNKDVAEKYGLPRITNSTWSKNKSKYFAALNQSLNKKKTKKQWLQSSWPRMLELLQRFASLHLHHTAGKLAFWLILSENKIPNIKNINLFAPSYCL